MILFLLGGILGVALVYALYWRASREAARLEEEKQGLMEERQIVLDYIGPRVDEQKLRGAAWLILCSPPYQVN